VDEVARLPPGLHVLVCAGDIVEGDPARSVDVVAEAADGKPAVYVLANHDVYGLALEDAVALARGRHSGVTVLDDDAVEIAGVKFAGGTLWESRNSARAGGGPAPHPREPVWEPIFVRHPGCAIDRRARAGTLYDRHDRTVAALRDLRAEVIVTHYPPTADDLVIVRPATWLHGHVHDRLDVRRGGHRLVRAPYRHGEIPVGMGDRGMQKVSPHALDQELRPVELNCPA
jgi:hypothetical protein